MLTVSRGGLPSLAQTGRREALIKSDSVAFYAQGDYKIVPDLTVSVGLRYTDDKKVFDGLAPLTAGLNAPLFPSHYTTGSKGAVSPLRTSLHLADFRSRADAFS